MNITITGAAGFIGSTIAKELTNENLCLIDTLEYGNKDNLGSLSEKLIVDDCRNTKNFNNADVILHFAGISSLPECEAYPCKAYENNVASTAAVLDYARSHASKVIFASTSAVYENNFGCLYEDDKVLPSLVYPNTKYSAEQLCKSFSKNYEVNTIICRFFNVFGPNQDYRRKNPPFTSAIAKAIINDESFTLYNSSRDYERNYIYVDDLVYFLKKMIYSEKMFHGDIFNVTSDYSYSPPQIIDILETVSKKKLNYTIGDPMSFWSKYSQLKSLDPRVIKHEIYKSSVGNNKKLLNEFSKDYVFTSMYDGLKNILLYQQKENE